MNNSRFFTARKISWFAVLLALVIVLQIWGSAIPFAGTNLNLTLIPVVLGSILLGPFAGALLGVAVGVVITINALAGTDGFTLYLYQGSPIMTFLIIFVKGFLAGFVSGSVFKALKSKPVLAVFLAACSAPIVNTSIFVIGTLIINGTIGGYMSTENITGQSVVYFIIIGCAGFNFLAEFTINAVFAPALYRIIRVVGKATGILPNSDEEQKNADGKKTFDDVLE